MGKEPEIVQGRDGHWRWHVPPQSATGESVDALPTFRSPLAFRTREEATADIALHASSTRDASGRQVMPKDYLRRLISALALPCDECADVYFGGVYWHRRDADGANWGVAIMNGAGDHDACSACVLAAKEDLRRRFSIVDEA